MTMKRKTRIERVYNEDTGWFETREVELNSYSFTDDDRIMIVREYMESGLPAEEIIKKYYISSRTVLFLITAKPKAHAFKNEMCFPLTKTKCELKKHPNSKFECFFNDFNRTKTSLFLPFPSKLIQDNLVCVLELQE